ncbi:MAG: DNA polymerase III subunit alpha [Chloroflexi bacterium]|nr:DNA polymerase III subunit alpha [Chloroflexota bacterium]
MPPAGATPPRWSWQRFETKRNDQEAALAPDTPRSRAGRAPRPASDTAAPSAHLDGVPYVELHAHSNYSLLEGASHPSELIAQALAQGHRALALTDHDGMFGAMEFARAAVEAGLQPITGLEVTIAEDDGTRSHLTLLAETRAGYAQLCRLASLAFGLGEDDPARKELRRLDPCVPLAALPRHATGVIALTGCRQGRLAQLLDAGRGAEAERTLRRYVQWYGPDQVFVELVDNYVFGDRPRNMALVRLAEHAGVPVVGTGDVHYHEPGRHRLQDVLVAIRHRKTLDDAHRERRANGECYLRSPHEQARRFAQYHPDAAANAVRIARRCTFDLTADLGYQLPSPPVPDGSTPLAQLERICQERIGRKYVQSRERAQAEQRLAEELRLVALHDLAGFFLVYFEVMQLAEEVAREVRGPSRARSVTELPPGRGRGSSVSSIICYLIGLSHIDPVRNNLFIRRFLNEELYSLPDIDLDFPRDIRERLIERVYERWGKDHAALVAIFPTYRARSAIRDVGKALGLPAAELDRLARRAGPYVEASAVAEELARAPDAATHAEARGWQQLATISSALAGFPRHMSQHVGGMVISSKPLIDCVPCQPAAWPNRYLCHWDKDSIDDARMVKIDFLALGMLSAVEECVDLIEQHRGRVVDLSRIPFDDQAVYDAICKGDTVGVFQIESRAQVAMLPRTQPRTLDDLTVQVSIVRPGPIVGGAVNPYVRRRERLRRDPLYRPEMPHHSVADVLAETLGVVIFQEQVLQVCEQMGGFTPGDADTFRRAMSRRRSHEAIEAYRERFMRGAADRDVPVTVAARMFETLLGFAEFGFPKSHGAAFGLLAYQSTWLRCYFAPEFTCALFNAQPMGFYPPHVLTGDAQRHGVEVRRPDVNASAADCTVEGHAVRVGLCYVQHVGEAGGRRIEEERRRAGPYRSLFDLTQRTGLPRRAIEALIQVGAFDAFGLNRRELLWQLGLFSGGMQRSVLRVPQARQLRMDLATAQDEVALPDFTTYERMAADYALLHLSPDAHPMQFLRPALGEGVLSSRHLQGIAGRHTVEVAGLVVCRQRPLTARGIVFLLLEDEHGMVNVLVSRELGEQEREVVHLAPFVVARGELAVRAGEQRTLVATALRELLPADALAMPRGKSWA